MAVESDKCTRLCLLQQELTEVDECMKETGSDKLKQRHDELCNEIKKELGWL